MSHLMSWEKNMDTNEYKIIITPMAYKEINEIYDYITENLYAENASKRLMKKVEEEIQKLKYAPKIHAEIEKQDELRRIYRRIVIDNYIILYTIDTENKTIFIAHMYYGGRNYLSDGLL